MMDTHTWWLCTNSKEQLGWRDSDSDGLLDIVDTFPDTTLYPYSPDPVNKSVLIYSGFVSENPYPNSNLYGTSRNITINIITIFNSESMGERGKMQHRRWCFRRG